MGNRFLVLAYSLVWLIFILYVWNLSRRQAQVRRDLEDLKAKTKGPPQPPQRP